MNFVRARQTLDASKRARSPGAGELGGTVRTFQTRFSSITSECQQVIAKHSQFPGIDLLQRRLTELQRTLSEQFNNGGNKDGYSERVHVLEKLNYANGMLQGVVEMIIEHHEYWKNKLANLGYQPLARRLNFSVTPSSMSATGTTTSSSTSTSLVDQHRDRLSQLQVAQNQPALPVTMVTSSQQFQLGCVVPSNTSTTSHPTSTPLTGGAFSGPGPIQHS